MDMIIHCVTFYHNMMVKEAVGAHDERDFNRYFQKKDKILELEKLIKDLQKGKKFKFVYFEELNLP